MRWSPDDGSAIGSLAGDAHAHERGTARRVGAHSFNQRQISGFSISVLAIHHRLTSRPSGHELCWVAPTAHRHQARSRPVHPAPTTPPKHSSRWQVSWLAGRCHQPPSREFPVAPAWGSSLTVAGAAPALRELAPASLFTSHEGGPSAATLSADACAVNRRRCPTSPLEGCRHSLC